MIRFLRAFTWLRWRLVVNGLKGGRRRDAMERAARVAAVVVPIVFAIVLVCVAAALGVLAFAAGRMVASRSLDAAVVLAVARLLLMLVLAVLVLVPLGRSMSGSTSGMARLVLLPIPRRALHLVEVAAGLADPWVAIVVPALFLLPLGLASGGAARAGLAALASGCAFLALVACLGALVSFLVEWLLRDRRRGEILSLLGIVVISMVGMVPAFLDAGRPKAREERGVRIPLASLDGALPAWAVAVPSEMYGRSIKMALDHRPGVAAAAVAALLVEAAILFGLSSRVHAKLMESPESGRSRRRGPARDARRFLLPGLSPAASAVAIAHVRLALRTVRGKMSVFFTGPFLLLMGLLLRRTMERRVAALASPDEGYLFLAAGTVFGLMALQPFLMNQFAVDGAGLTLQFLAPIEDRDLLRGKTAGGALLLGTSFLLSLAASIVLAPHGSILLWCAVLAGGAASYLLLAPLAALLSLLLPKKVDLNKMGNAGNPHGLASLLGTLASFAAAIPASIIVLIGGFYLQSPAITCGAALAWLALAGGICVWMLGVVAELVPRRRENLALAATGR